MLWIGDRTRSIDEAHIEYMRGIANPIGQIWAGAMMLDHLGHKDASENIVRAIEEVLQKKEYRTGDLGGIANTKICGNAVADAI